MKNRNAVALGRLGGLAKNAKLSRAEREAVAKKLSAARAAKPTNRAKGLPPKTRTPATPAKTQREPWVQCTVCKQSWANTIDGRETLADHFCPNRMYR